MPFRPASRAAGIGLAAGLHAAIIGLLLADASRHASTGGAPARAFLLVPLLVPPRATAPAPPAPLPTPIQRRPRPPGRAPAPAPPSPMPPAATAMTAPVPVIPPVAADPFAAPAAPAAPSLVERARGSAGRIARELSQESGSVLTPDAQAARRDKAFGRAWQGGSHGFTVDRYVSPDGTSVTRQTSRRGVSCYIPAPFQPSAIARSSERQKEVSCPPDDGRWQRQ